MTTLFARFLTGTLLFVLLLAAGCNGTEAFTGTCTVDTQCPTGSFCRAGLCACRSNEACETGQFCNNQGQCQKREGCRENADCAATDFCDLATGACLARTACGADLHCDPGSVCDPARRACVSGCTATDDCPLYSSCEGATATALGRCAAGRCDDPTFCAFGSLCQNNMCVPSNDANLCRACDAGADTCGGPGNFCLINPFYDPALPDPRQPANFCGTACNQPGDCPAGYRCGDVSLVTNVRCRNDPDCGGQGRRCGIAEGGSVGSCSCAVDADCAFDSVPATCAGSCSGLGFQACTQNDQCASRNCVLTNKTCTNPRGQRCNQDTDCQAQDFCADQGGGVRLCLTSGARCSSNDDCLCVAGSCANLGGRSCRTAADCKLTCVGGGCLFGRSCAPIDGLSCADVKGTR